MAAFLSFCKPNRALSEAATARGVIRLLRPEPPAPSIAENHRFHPAFARPSTRLCPRSRHDWLMVWQFLVRSRHDADSPGTLLSLFAGFVGRGSQPVGSPDCLRPPPPRGLRAGVPGGGTPFARRVAPGLTPTALAATGHRQSASPCRVPELVLSHFPRPGYPAAVWRGSGMVVDVPDPWCRSWWNVCPWHVVLVVCAWGSGWPLARPAATPCMET